MATNIRLKSSSLAGKTPTLSDLSLRELAVNTADGKLFLRKGDGSGTDKIIDVTGPLQASEPMGHEDKTQSIISFNSTTRVFTIQPVSTSFNVWCKGVKYNFTTAQTVTLPNTTGIYYIYFDGDGVLQQRTSYFDWENDAPTAYVYWNATTGTAPFVADERHGIVLDWQTHEYLHRTRGAVIANGFSISNYTTTGTGANNTDAQFDLGGGTFFDEDLEVVITHSNTPTSDTWQQDLQGPARIPVFYQSGNAWVRDTPTDYAAKQGTARIQYNFFNGASWSALDVSSDSWYTTSWIIATNNINYPVIAIMGQTANNKITDEESIGFGDLVLDGFPVVEFRPLWKIIWQTDSGYANTPNARIAGVYDIRQLSAGGGFTGATPVSDHGLLTGLGDDDHLQYLHVTETRNGVTAEFNTTGKITTTSNIGVGTSNPTAKLDVLGGDIVLTTASDPRVYIQTTGISGAGFDIKKSDNSWSWRFTGEAEGFKIRDHFNSLDKFYIEDGASGNVWFNNIANVGIGTTNPTEKLHLYDNYVLTSNTFTRKVGVFNNIERQTSSDSYSASSIYGTYNSYSQIPPLNASASVFSVTGIRNDVGIYTGSVTSTVYGAYNYTRLGLFSGGSGVSVGDVVSVYNELSTGNQTNTITNAYGIRNIVNINTNSTITNSYGIHLSKTGAGVITNNWSIYSSDGTSKMYHEGNVGIGTTNPTQKLSVIGDSYTSGKLLVGTTTPITKLFGAVTNFGATVNVATTAVEYGAVFCSYRSDSTTASGVSIAKSKSNTPDGHGILGTDEPVGILSFDASDGTQFINVSRIRSTVEGTPAEGNIPGNLQFWTNSGSSIQPTEKVRITGSGNVGIGTTNPSNLLHLYNSTSNQVLINLQNANTGGNSWLLQSSGGAAGNGQGQFSIFDLNAQSYRLVISPSGNVGIGTTNPTSKLHTIGTGLFENDGGFSGPTSDDYPKVPLIAKLSNTAGNTFFGAINPYNYPAFAINVYGYSNSSTNRGRVEFYDKTDGNWNKSIVLNTGYVGIGTDTPGSKLAVNGYITESTDGGVTYHNVVTQQDIGFNANQIPLNQYLGQLAFMDTYSPSGLRRDGGGSDDVIVNSSGNVGIGTTNPRQKLEIYSDTFDGLRINTNSEYPTIWLAQSGTDKWSISSNLNNDNAFVIRESTVADRLTILTGGNVGIGTTNPTSTLHVQGSARITGSIASTNYFITTSTGSVTGGAAIPISNISATSYRSVEYIIQAVSTTNHQVTKLLLVHNGTNAYITEYGSMTTNAQVASYTADISNNSIVVTATPASANTTNFKVYATAIAV